MRMMRSVEKAAAQQGTPLKRSRRTTRVTDSSIASGPPSLAGSPRPGAQEPGAQQGTPRTPGMSSLRPGFLQPAGLHND